MFSTFLVWVGLACQSPAADPPTVAAPPEPDPELQGPPLPFDPPEPVARLHAPRLTESSGLAPSIRQPGTWWTMNDSGNPAELFHFDLEGRLLGRHEVPGIENRDWEDLAAGACPSSGRPCLYVAEIGDNKHRYEWVAVYAVREPEADEPAGIVATWRARYPNGARNAETLLRDPFTGLLYLVTKEEHGLSEVYRFPAQPSEAPGLLELVATVQFEGEGESMLKATGGDWSADGARVVVRTYQVAWEWDVQASDREAHWAEPPRRAWLAVEDQGEAVAYTPDGGLLTTSEGLPMPVNRVPRPDAAGTR
jgi:hypothetical protein